MEMFKSVQLGVFYGLIVLSFAVNIYFLAKRLCSLFLQNKVKNRILIVFGFFSVVYFSAVLFPTIAVRSGYDNNHDFNYLSRSFFDIKQIGFITTEKEASPAITDAITDAISGCSLKSIVWKNRLLVLLSVLIFFAALIKLELDYTAALIGGALFYFNFLTILNANTFTTTCANMFFWISSFFAIICWAKEDGNRKSNFIWALGAIFLTLTGRYELFIVSALFFFAAGLSVYGAEIFRLKFLKKEIIAVMVCVLYAGICALWLVHINEISSYNGPGIKGVLNWADNFKYQLIEHNIGVFMPLKSNLIQVATLLLLFLVFARGLADKINRKRVFFTGGFMVLWMFYFSVIFMPLDLYPLHFMRHRFYFFVPFVVLGALGWDSLAFFIKSFRSGFIIKPLITIFFIGGYCVLNIKAARSFNNELRTNDIELNFLAKEQENWNSNHIVVYPAFDERYFFLKKYFPFYEDCSLIEAARYFKYVSPKRFTMSEDENIIQNYHPSKANYIKNEDKSFSKISFNHKFYTAWRGVETRLEIPLEIGFYHADSPKDRAWLLNSSGYCAFKSGNFDEASAFFKEAVKTDSDCIVCAYNRSADCAFSGKEKESLTAIKNIIESQSSLGAPLFEKALVSMASSKNEEAARFLMAFQGGEISENGHQNEVLLMMASDYLKILKARKNRAARSNE